MYKRIVNSVLYAVISLLLAGILAIVIAKIYGYRFVEVIFWIGIIVVMLGGMSSIAGSATGSRIYDGSSDSQYQSSANFEALRMERDSTNFFTNFKKNAVFDPEVSTLSIILAGILLVLTGYFLS